MKTLLAASAALALALPLAAQDAPPPEPEVYPSPNQIVEDASAAEWIAIAPEDLLAMTLAPAPDGSTREVVIQFMPPPFSQGWVENIRTLARAGWYDGISVNRVQDNYVVQWGDPNVDNPEAEGEVKALPDGLRVMDEEDYIIRTRIDGGLDTTETRFLLQSFASQASPNVTNRRSLFYTGQGPTLDENFISGWPISLLTIGPFEPGNFAPVHCYGMVGVGRSYSPDTGTGAELYTVIGHAPRHLDRNIALVGRVVEGIEHLSSLPRGKGALGFYEDPAKRVPIASIRVVSDLPAGDRPAFEYLSTEGETFARYAEARANRRDPFFIVPAGGADICNIPVPVRRAGAGG